MNHLRYFMSEQHQQHHNHSRRRHQSSECLSGTRLICEVCRGPDKYHGNVRVIAIRREIRRAEQRCKLSTERYESGISRSHGLSGALIRFWLISCVLHNFQPLTKLCKAMRGHSWESYGSCPALGDNCNGWQSVDLDGQLLGPLCSLLWLVLASFRALYWTTLIIFETSHCTLTLYKPCANLLHIVNALIYFEKYANHICVFSNCVDKNDAVVRLSYLYILSCTRFSP